MLRLVLAVAIVAALAALLALLALGLRVVWRDAGGGRAVVPATDGTMPRVAYVLLVGLMLYVGLWGGG